MAKCQPGCECGRHKNHTHVCPGLDICLDKRHSGGGLPCPKDCTCAKHEVSEEHRRNLAKSQTKESRQVASEKSKATKIAKGIPLGGTVESAAKANETKRKNGTVGGFKKGYVASAEHRRHNSEAQKNRPPVSDETRKKLSVAGSGRVGPWLGKSQSEETSQKKRLAMRAYWMQPNLDRKTGHSGYGAKSGYYKETGIWMRSRLERDYAELLDSNGIEWRYESRRFALTCGTYIPDFYLPRMGIYVELKGWMTETAQMKVDCFRNETDEILTIIQFNEFYKELQSL